MTLVRKAAFDVGSGSIKLQCADCLINSSKVTILKTIFGVEVPLAMGAALLNSESGTLNESIQLQGIQILTDLKKRAEDFGAFHFSSIATEVYRKALNGEEYLQRIRDIGIPCTLVSQLQEAKLGFESVTSQENTTVNPCVWDSGGASFQISSRNLSSDDFQLDTYMGALGTSVTTSILVQEIYRRELKSVATVNPVTDDDASALIDKIKSKLAHVPGWLQNKDLVLAATGANSMFKLCSIVLTSLTTDGQEVTAFTLNDAQRALSYCLQKTDEDLRLFASFEHAEGPHVVIQKLALLVAVMSHTGIRNVKAVTCIGSCAGLLTDNNFWDMK